MLPYADVRYDADAGAFLVKAKEQTYFADFYIHFQLDTAVVYDLKTGEV